MMNQFKWMMYPYLPTNCDKPPTVYSLLDAIVNFNNPNPAKIKDLASEGRTTIFDFEYPLSSKVDKEYFETQILKKFLMRRINFDTLTAFKIQLDVKLNEIMPVYNKLFDALDGWEIFKDGEIQSRNVIDSRITNSSNELYNHTVSANTSDRRNSDTPQNQLTDVRDGYYVSNYNYDTNNDDATSTSNGSNETTDDGKLSEEIKRTPADKIAVYKNFIENRNNIMTMIYSDLNELFYGLI